MERDYKWHGNPPGTEIAGEPPKEEQEKIALNELHSLGGQIESQHR